MPRRLPDDVVHRILIRLSASEPVPSIATAVGVAHETVYRMQCNVEAGSGQSLLEGISDCPVKVTARYF